MKDEILNLLKQSNGYLSGEYLSNLFGVSRAAVWKSIKQLEKEGYVIFSKSKVGYQLVDIPDRLYPCELKPYLFSSILGNEIYYFDELDSTNSYAKNLPDNFIKEGIVVLTEYQSKGRGRFNRHWVSPKYKGLYFSFILKPNISFDNIGHLTILFALAVCKTLEDHTKKTFEIKWPNDILYQGKKVCGILTEVNGEIDAIRHVIVGVGINVNSDIGDFDEDIRHKATSLKIITESKVDRILLLSEIINNADEYYASYSEDVDFMTILSEYKSKLSILNKEIHISIGSNLIKGTAIDIAHNGALKIKLRDGNMREFISGEVSIIQ
ncbi:MAG: biotin--[acetyl-CoA-carboxylase] ligase [Eubacteriales bacterium]